MKRQAPRGPHPAVVRAVQLQQGAQPEAAECVLRELLRGAPRMPDAVHLLGLVRHQRGDLAEATELLTRAVALSPGSVDAWRNLGNVCEQAGDHARAETSF